jgi:hypothetical protein
MPTLACESWPSCTLTRLGQPRDNFRPRSLTRHATVELERGPFPRLLLGEATSVDERRDNQILNALSEREPRATAGKHAGTIIAARVGKQGRDDHQL